MSTFIFTSFYECSVLLSFKTFTIVDQIKAENYFIQQPFLFENVIIIYRRFFLLFCLESMEKIKKLIIFYLKSIKRSVIEGNFVDRVQNYESGPRNLFVGWSSLTFVKLWRKWTFIDKNRQDLARFDKNCQALSINQENYQ